MSPTEGGVPFEVHTYVEVPAFASPGVLEWESGSGQKSHDIALLRPRFRVENVTVSVTVRIRNDRGLPILVLPFGHMTILEISPELRDKGYDFECIAATQSRIEPGMEVAASLHFRRKFDVLPTELFPPMRVLHLTLPILTQDEDVVYIKLAEMFPLEIWASQPFQGF